MADINWTAALPQPSAMTFGINVASLDHTSQLTGVTQSVSVPGSRWFATLTYDALTRADAARLQALIVKLRGRENRLVMHNLAKPNITGVGGGAPLVNGAGQTGASINIDGLPFSTTGVYKAGDFIGIGGELKMVTDDVDSNGAGQATVMFEPPLRASPADDSAIVTYQPTAKFMLMNKEASWLYMDPATVRSIELQLNEVFA